MIPYPQIAYPEKQDPVKPPEQEKPPKQQALRLSIVLEWENVGLAGFARTRQMLEELRRQVTALASDAPRCRGSGEVDPAPSAGPPEAAPRLSLPVELVVVFDPTGSAGGELQRAVRAVLGSDASAFHLVPVEAPGERYYALKNRGAALATGDVILFLDSDVIPQPEWLAHLLAPFSDPAVEGVAGTSFIEPRDLLTKTMALCGVFPLAPDEIVIERRRSFFANNLALRRALVERAPFPRLDVGLARVACAYLAARLYDEGHAVYVHTGARVRHPAPRGFGHLLLRALAHGRDDLHLPGRRSESLVAELRHGRDRTAYYLRRVWRDRRRVGLSTAELPLALGIALLFHSVRTLGSVLTHVSPRLMHTHFLRV